VISEIGRAIARRSQRTGDVRELATDWRVTVKRRTVVAAVLFGVWAVGIEARLFHLQVIERADLVARAERQQLRTVAAPAKRGDILDRKGRVLATSVDADTIYAVPSDITDQPAAVARLCEALRDCTDRERQTLVDRLRRQRNFAYIRRQVSPDEAKRVADLNLEGIGFLKESRRFYPKRELGAHLLGYVGLDNNGLGGIEFAYEKQIRGKDGKIQIHTDARHHAFSRFERPSDMPTAGASFELTIDEYLQHVTERELHAGVVASHAAGGSVVVMDPHTGEILAMANEPTFNPNAYREFPEDNQRNRAVQDLYEPGSTFKVVTASAAIEERVMPITTMIDTSPGIIKVGNDIIDEFANHNYGLLSFTDVIVQSSNVGAIKIGFKVGTERLSRYVQRFGFGQQLSPDFPGESSGIVWETEKWTERALASVSMGYQVGVTPLQMVAAVSSVANGGELVEPRAIRAMYRDNRRYVVRPKTLRRTVSQETAAVVTTIMESVVANGTGTTAQVPGYTIAGKTGTASKLINGRYSATENNVSFVGFFPSRNPVAAIIVVIDTPHAASNTGGMVAAPVFQRIAEATLRYLAVAPTVNPAPPVLIAREKPGTLVPTTGPDQEPMVSLVHDGPAGVVPDLRGLSARAAMRKLVALGMTAQMTGNGFVTSQEPAAGTPIEHGAVGRLQLERTLRAPAARTARP
jgi:cell division protein FtsI (penicillin-binding protein 3)